MKQKIIFSNFEKLGFERQKRPEIEHVYIGDGAGQWSAWKLFLQSRNADAVILNIDHTRLLKFCFLKWALPFLNRAQLISVDILLRVPRGFSSKILAFVKSILFKKVDIFVLYFKKTEGYSKWFALEEKKIVYIPFKVNSWEERFANYKADPLHGDYVLCAGQTFRDLSTYIEAIRIAKVPAVLLTPGSSAMQAHGTNLTTENFPETLRLEVHNDGKEETFLNWIKNAAIVVIPRFGFDIASTGISTYLCSMAAHRCVILSKGPGADELLKDGEALLVDPENPKQLAEMIRKAWDDKNLRKSTAEKGRKYAEALQGETRLLNDILKIATAVKP